MTTRIEAFDQSGSSPPEGMESHPFPLFRAATYYIPNSAGSQETLVQPQQTQSLPDHLLTVKEAAAYARVCEESLRRAYRTNQLRVQPLGRRSIRIHPMDLIDWLGRGAKTKPGRVN